MFWQRYLGRLMPWIRAWQAEALACDGEPQDIPDWLERDIRRTLREAVARQRLQPTEEAVMLARLVAEMQQTGRRQWPRQLGWGSVGVALASLLIIFSLFSACFAPVAHFDQADAVTPIVKCALLGGEQPTRASTPTPANIGLQPMPRPAMDLTLITVEETISPAATLRASCWN